jgi:D-alanine-D-alanine ligase
MTSKREVTILYDAAEDEEQPPGADTPVHKEVHRVLGARGHSIQHIAVQPNVCELVQQIERDSSDIVFNLCESFDGVDLRAINVAAILELMRKPFTGTGSFGLTLAQDKSLAKKIFSFHGMQHPKFSVMHAGQVEWSDELKFPLFVKPSNTDSSVGIDAGALVHNIKELMERISYIHTEIKASVLIEEFIDGREIFVGVLGNETMEALPIVEWDFSEVKGPKFATAEAKWNKQSEGYRAPERFPEDIPEAAYKRIQNAAVDACKALRVNDYGRVDMRLRPDDWSFYIIEVNPNPYLEEHSELALAAAKAGLGYADLIERILSLAEKRTFGSSF